MDPGSSSAQPGQQHQQPGQGAHGGQQGPQPAGQLAQQQQQQGAHVGAHPRPSDMQLAHILTHYQQRLERQEEVIAQQQRESEESRSFMQQMMSLLQPQQQSQPQQPQPSSAPSSQPQQHSRVQPQQQSQQQTSSVALQVQPGEPQFITGNTKLSTLHAHNWETWRLDFESLLVQHNLMHTVVSDGQPSQRASDLARSLMVANVDHYLRPLVQEPPTAYAAWQQLHQHFSKQLRFQVPILEQQLHTLRIGPTEGVLSYVQRARNLRRDLFSSGRPELAGSVASHMLSGLPDSKFGLVKEQLWMWGVTELEQMASHLQAREQRMHLSAQQHRQQQFSQAAVAAPARAPSRGGGSRGRGRGRGNTAGGRTTPTADATAAARQQEAAAAPKAAGTNGVFKQGVVCLNPQCRREGHYVSQCPLRSSTTTAKTAEPQQQQQPANTMTVVQSAQLALLPAPPAADLWRLDSGAGRHITPFAHVFLSSQPLHNAFVRTAGTQTLPAVAHGTVALQLEHDDCPITLLLHDVWHVPAASAQLFSPLAAKSHGLSTHFEPQAVWLQGKAGMLMEAHLDESGLYAIQAEPQPPQPAIAALEMEPVEAPQELEEAELSAHGQGEAADTREKVEQEDDGHGQMRCLEQEVAPRASMEQEEDVADAVSSELEDARVSMEQAVNAPRVGVGDGAWEQEEEDVSKELEDDGARPAVPCPSMGNDTPAKGARELAQVQRAASAKEQEEIEVLHRRMGHLGPTKLSLLSHQVHGTRPFSHTAAVHALSHCHECMARRPALPHPLTHKRASRPLELVHADTVGPISPLSQPTLNRWLLTVLDDYSGYCWAVPLFDKGMAPRALKHLLQQLQRQSGKRILALRTDRGREFMGDLLPFLSAEGIQHQLSAPYEHQQNGRAERLNRELVQRAAVMLHGAALPLTLWDEAAVTASMLHNLAPSAAANNQHTAHECMWGEKPDLSRLRAYGALCWVHVPFTQRPSKFSLPREPGRLVGYEHAAYRVLVKHGKVRVCADAVFDERPVPTSHHQPVVSTHPNPAAPHEPTTRLALLPVPQHSTEHALPLHTQARLPEPSSSSDASSSPPPPHHSASPAHSPPPALPEPAQQQRTGARPRQPPVWMRDMEALTSSSNSTPAQLADAHTECTALAAAAQAEHDGAEPISLRDALSQPEAAQWLAAAAEEMHSLEQHGTWELLPTPPGVRPLPVRWVFKRKPESGGNVRHKARLVAKGFAQRPGVDFGDVFAPVCKQSTLHALLAITAAHDLELHQLDVKTAFLNGELQEEVWMQQPEGFQQGGPGLSCRLRRAIYGLKQAPRAWHAKLRAVLLELGFQQSEADPALFMRPGECYVLTYVDDMLVAGQHLQHVHAAKQALLQRFEGRDMGEAQCFLGQHIQRDRAQRKLTVHQQQHVQALLQRHSMEHRKPNAVPLSSSARLTSSIPEQQPLADSSVYSQLVGSLLYLSTCTRPDIAFATGLLSRFMSRPTQLHLTAAKSVLRYLAGTAGYGLQFAAAPSMHHHHSPHSSKQQQQHSLTAFCDADWAGCQDTSRSTSGYVFLLHGAAVSWSSKRQSTVALSTAEAEYMAAAWAVREALAWLKLQEDQLPVLSSSSVPLATDNQATLCMLTNPMATQRSKHIATQYRFAREAVERGQVQVRHVCSEQQVADVLTKNLPLPKFVRARDALGVKPVA